MTLSQPAPQSLSEQANGLYKMAIFDCFWIVLKSLFDVINLLNNLNRFSSGCSTPMLSSLTDDDIFFLSLSLFCLYFAFPIPPPPNAPRLRPGARIFFLYTSRAFGSFVLVGLVGVYHKTDIEKSWKSWMTGGNPRRKCRRRGLSRSRWSAYH